MRGPFTKNQCNDLSFQTIRPCTANIDKDRLEKDVRLSFRYVRKEEEKIWWENVLRVGNIVLNKIELIEIYNFFFQIISECFHIFFLGRHWRCLFVWRRRHLGCFISEEDCLSAGSELSHTGSRPVWHRLRNSSGIKIMC